MPTTLNEDCWSIILAQLFGDFRTLARMMQVSRHFFVIVTPVLYAQLGHPDNKTQIQGWSPNKSRNLSILLLVSSAFLELTTTKSTTTTTTAATRGTLGSTAEKGRADGSSNSRSDNLVQRNSRILMNRHLQVSHLGTPLLIDYFGLLTGLSKHLFHTELWDCIMGFKDDYDAHGVRIQRDIQLLNQSLDRHAKVLTEVYVQKPSNIEQWLQVVEKLEKLELLVIDIKVYIESQKREKLHEFVRRHKATFPGKLKEIRSTRLWSTELEMGLNILLERPRTLKLLWHGRITKLFQNDEGDGKVDKGSGGCGRTSNSGRRESISGGGGGSGSHKLKTVFGSIKHIKLIDAPLSRDDEEIFSAFVKNALQECRQLETFQIRGPAAPLNELFDWTVHDFRDALVVAKGMMASDLEQSSSSSSTSSPTDLLATLLPPRSLIPLKSFSGRGVCGSILMNVLNGFRASLEHVDFSGARRLRIISLDWSWMLPRLRVLKLGHCMIQFCKLEMYCPALEELYLDHVDSPEGNMEALEDNDIQVHRSTTNNTHFDHRLEISLAKRPWRVMPTLRVFHLKQASFRSTKLDLLSVGNLLHLEDFYLAENGPVVVDEDNTFNRIQPVRLLQWDFKRLRKLNLLEFSDLNCHRLLLRSAPNLQQCSMPVGAFCSTSGLGGFWQETRWQTLERVAEFERQMNSLWPDLEQVGRQQKVDLEAEKLIVGKYRTLDGKDIWNAHVSKIRFLEFGGKWTGAQVGELSMMLQSGEWETKTFGCNHNNSISNINLNQGNENFNSPIIMDTNLSSIGDKMCFPQLCHVKFNLSTKIESAGWNDFQMMIEKLLRRKGMISLEIPQHVLMGKLAATLEQFSPECVPSKWQKGEYCDMEEDDYGVDREGRGCVLVVQFSSRSLIYYRLRE